MFDKIVIGRNGLIGIIIFLISIIVLGIIIFPVQAYFLSPSVHTSDFFSVVWDNSVWIDETNGYSLTIKDRTECGILEHETLEEPIVVCFSIGKEAEDGKFVYFTSYDPKEMEKSPTYVSGSIRCVSVWRVGIY